MAYDGVGYERSVKRYNSDTMKLFDDEANDRNGRGLRFRILRIEFVTRWRGRHGAVVEAIVPGVAVAYSRLNSTLTVVYRSSSAVVRIT
jgi:hypothetical protein